MCFMAVNSNSQKAEPQGFGFLLSFVCLFGHAALSL